MAGTFICPDCGQVAEYDKKKRERCPECAKKRGQKRKNAEDAEIFRQHRAVKAILRQSKEEAAKIARERAKRDAEIDARSHAYIKKQCRFCKYRLRGGLNGKHTLGCDYISWKGHRSDKGSGPGDCRSFEMETELSKEERINRRRRAITISEADHAKNTGEQLRDVNQL